MPTNYTCIFKEKQKCFVFLFKSQNGDYKQTEDSSSMGSSDKKDNLYVSISQFHQIKLKIELVLKNEIWSNKAM